MEHTNSNIAKIRQVIFLVVLFNCGCPHNEGVQRVPLPFISEKLSALLDWKELPLSLQVILVPLVWAGSGVAIVLVFLLQWPRGRWDTSSQNPYACWDPHQATASALWLPMSPLLNLPI